jgi:hypothetical protein
MRLSLCCNKSGSGGVVERRDTISSFLLYDFLCNPYLLCLEYNFEPHGRVFTIAVQHEKDFYELLSGSGLYQSMPSGLLFSPCCVYCVPFLFRGVPCVIRDVCSIIAADVSGSPFMFVRAGSNRFDTVIQGGAGVSNDVFQSKLADCIAADYRVNPFIN